MVQGYKEELDTLLVFVRPPNSILTAFVRSILQQAGLFSAVLTAFVIESYSSLQPDASQASVQALYYISLQLHNSSIPALVPPSPSEFVPARSDMWINALWFTSLVIALTSALVAIFVKQWAREYLSWTAASPGRDSVALRQYRYKAWMRWGGQHWRDVVAGLLQLGLVLFFGGLVILLWQLNGAIASIVTAAVGVSMGCLLVSIILPVFFVSCPYRNTLSWTLRRSAVRITMLLRVTSRSQRWSWYNLKHRCSWIHQEINAIRDERHDNQHASDGVFDVLRARPLLKTLDDVSPCLYTSSFASGIELQAIRAMIEAVLEIEDPQLTFQDPEWYWSFRDKRAPIPQALAWRITALARQALLAQTRVLVTHATQLVHFVTAMAARDSHMTAYHMCTLVRLLSNKVPEPLSQAAWEDIARNSWMRKVPRVIPCDVLQFMIGTSSPLPPFPFSPGAPSLQTLVD
jgi:hypothetical protein